MSLGTALSPAGLRLLVAPINSPFLGSAACNFAGAMYPAYATFKALEQKECRPQTQSSSRESDENNEFKIWSCYWAVFGALRLVETLVDPILSIVPYYYPAKLALLLWLQLPQFRGAGVLYHQYMKPVLQRYEPKVDLILEYLKQSEWVIEAHRPYFIMMKEILRASFNNVKEFLKWFLSTEATERIEPNPTPKEE